jgi:hypothetical protein
MATVTRVPFLYGGHYYVAADDLANPRKIMLPLYTRDGRKWEDTQAGQRAARKHEATMLHRENIGPATA